MLGKNENEGAALLDRARDLAGIGTAGQNVARRDPAPDPDTLERRANGVGYRAIIRRVRNENIVRHVFDFLIRSRFSLWIRSLEGFPGMKQFQSESVSRPPARE